MSNQIFIPENTKDLKEWFNEQGENFFKNIGLKRGQKLADIGCGVGTYAIPATKVIGKFGKVFAIDNNKNCIKELKRRISARGLSNIIIPILTDGAFTFPFENNSLDFILMVDFIGVLVHEAKSLHPVEELMKEVYRITHSNGKIVMIFKHVKNWRIQKCKIEIIINKYFTVEAVKEIPNIHWNFKEIDSVYIYTKK